MNDKVNSRTILMIEDEPAFLRMMKKWLEYKGFQVITANNGLDGLSTARNENPDLIILDIMLPGLDGLKVCRMIKSDSKLRNIPVAMLTSRDLESDAETAKKCGANAFIVKTTRPEIVIEVVQKLIEEKS